VRKTIPLALALLAIGIMAIFASLFLVLVSVLSSIGGLIVVAGIFIIGAISVIVAVTLLFALLFSKANQHIRILIFSAVAFFAGTLAGVPEVNYLAAIGGAALFAVSIFSASKPAEKIAEEGGLSIESEEPRIESSSRALMLKFSAIGIALGVFLLSAHSAGLQPASVELRVLSSRHFRSMVYLSQEGKHLRISPLDEAGFQGLHMQRRDLILVADFYNRRGERMVNSTGIVSWNIEGLTSEDRYDEFTWVGPNLPPAVALNLHLTDEHRTLNFTVSRAGGMIAGDRIYDTITVIVDPAVSSAETPQEVFQ